MQPMGPLMVAPLATVPFSQPGAFNSTGANSITNGVGPNQGLFTVGSGAAGIYEVFIGITANGSDMFQLQQRTPPGAFFDVPHGSLNGSPSASVNPLPTLISVAAGDQIKLINSDTMNDATIKSSDADVAFIVFLRVAP